ncbi:hypothetical protein HPB52_010013 [Rhipicephalus sanguineus]|uniref:FMN hydroxy acid dehydrogenase domain-containing protein n=1 Tax=Rhipicephalus sanguineus TaxID=34632 RepID=A0A9D4SSD4_RHISA|nr:hypothetical protein HPB52_010013 [Rhipicephalus sanguineus]
MVSNHGGRQLDCVPATIDVLPDVVRAVGHRCEVYVDGGVRLGTDVVKAIALGARAVFVGRPVLYGLAYSGEEGVVKVLDILRAETDRAMALMGEADIMESQSLAVASCTNVNPARTVADIEKMGMAKLSPGPRFYYSMGADEERTLAENMQAFKGLRLLPRLLRGVVNRSLETVLLGQRVSLPVGISPTAFHKVAHPDGEAATARAAAKAGTVMIVSISSTTSLEDVREAAPNALLWFQLCIFADRTITHRLVRRAEEAGYSAIVYAADIPVGGSNSEKFGDFLKDYMEDLG